MFGDTRGGESVFAEATSVQRTAKARAHAAQYLLNDADTGVMPLLPDDPAQRISLHRQLRGRYNPTQIPLSSLSCSAYLGAGDVAELALLFRNFNLFSTEVISTLDAEVLNEADDGADPEQGTGGHASLSAARGSARRRQSPTPPRSGKAGSVAPPAAAAAEQAPAPAREVDVTEGKAGMELIRLVARPPSPTPPQQQSAVMSVAARASSTAAAAPRSASPPRAAGAAAGGGGGVKSPGASPVSPLKQGFPAARGGAGVAAAAATRERRELAESFTSEGSDCALTAGWLVELLMEMVVANSADAAGAAIGGTAAGGGGGNTGGAGGGVGGLGSSVVQATQQQASGGSVSASRPGTATRALHGYPNSTMSATLANPPSAIMNASVNVSYQTRRRDARVEQLRTFQAELTAWVEQLSQSCDEREHPGAWQQCAMQSEVLQRYEACALHSTASSALSPPNTAATASHVPHDSAGPSGLGGGPLSARVNTMNSANLAAPSSSLMLRANNGGVSPRSGGTTGSMASGASTVAGVGGAAGRGNVSWGLPNAISPVAPASSAQSSSRYGGPRMAKSESPGISPMPSWPTTAQGRRRTEAAGSSREPAGDSGPVFEVLPTAQAPGSSGKMNGSPTLSGPHAVQLTYDEMTSPIELIQSSASSLQASMLLPPTTTVNTMPPVLSSMNVSATGLGMSMGDRGAAAAAATAVKARLSAPSLRHLLQNPQQLYAFLWTSSAAARLAEEEERDNHLFQQQRSRLARSPHVPQLNRSDGSPQDRLPSAGNLSRTVSGISSRRNRAAPQQHLVCWSDVASNLLMGLETTWLSQRHDAAYGRVPTALLDDPAELAAATKAGASSTTGGGHGAGLGARRGSDAGRGIGDGSSGIGGGGMDDDSDSGDDGLGGLGGAANGAGVAGNGQSRRRRVHKDVSTAEVVALQQRATLLSSLGAAAESALGSLHAQSADHIVAAPSQCYTVTSSKDGLLKVWDTARGQFVSTILNIGQAWVLALTFLHGGEFLMVATSSAEITVVNFPGGGVVLKLRGCTSLATAVQQVKQPSTVFTKRYGLKPGECGRHKPIRSDGGGWLGTAAAAAGRMVEYSEGESEPIAARPIIGYVTPTAAFYEAEIGFFFFGTMSGMVGCVDLSTVFSRTALHAAAAGAGWSYPLQVYAAVLAHATVPADSHRRSRLGLSLSPVSPTQLPAESGANPLATAMPGTTAPAGSSTSTPTGRRMTRMRSSIAGPAAAIVASCNTTASNGVVGQQVRHILFCGVGHCLITADADGGIVRTPFTAAADTLDYALGTPTPVVTTAKAIRFLVSCVGGRRFITVHSDRRAILWAVGRTLTECVHQYPQQAYDIVDICFMQPHQQVAVLMADHSIQIFDERGSRPLATIQPPRSLSSRVEDMASITLKLSANDVDGCLTYLRTSQRLVCGLRGPVLYEPATRAAPPTGASAVSLADSGDAVRHSDATDTTGRSALGFDGLTAAAAAATTTVLPPAQPSASGVASLHRAAAQSASSQDSSMESSLVLLPPAQPAPHPDHLSFYAPSAGAAILGRPGPILAAARSATQAPSFYGSVGSSANNFEGEGSRADGERARVATLAAQEEVRRQRLINVALRRANLRLRPHQTHATAVIGILVDPVQRELHTFSTDTWCVWDYQTGERLRQPLNVPRAAERELAVRGRRALLTCCSWSTETRSRVLVGTRDSRVLTLDARVGSVVSSTDPFTQVVGRLATGAPSPLLLADKDVSAIAAAGSRTLMCSGRVCEVRRYEVTSAPQPSGEERFVSMRVELPLAPHVGLGAAGAAGAGSAAAVATSGASGPATAAGGGAAGGSSAGGTAPAAGTAPMSSGVNAAATTCGVTAAAAGAGGGGTVGNPAGASTHPANVVAALISGGVDTTITACCVVRESHLCLGTADTQLFFYRMVDRSAPVHLELLCDAHGVPDVGRVVKLHYLADPTQDVLLAIVDTGLLYIYSYTMQRMLGRYTFPPLGTKTVSSAPPAISPRGHAHALRQQAHYITSVAFTDAGRDASPLSSLTMACGDSAGYVHVVPLGSLVAEAVNSASRDTGATAHAPRGHELYVSASFRASRGGVSALGLVATDLAWAPRVNPGRFAAAPSGARGPSSSSSNSRAVVSLVDTGSANSTFAASPSSLQALEPHLLIFTSGYDGNVRAFGVAPGEEQQHEMSPPFASGLASTATTAGWSPGMTQMPLLQTATMGATVVSGTGLSHAAVTAARGSFVRSGGGAGMASAMAAAAGLVGLRATTIGLCGVDRWSIGVPATFSDVEQAAFTVQMHREARVDVVLPSILNEEETEGTARGPTTRLDAAGAGADAAPDRSRGSPTTTAGPTSSSVVGVTYTNGKESGVVLLYEILRSSKKALGTLLPAAGTTNGLGLLVTPPPSQRTAAAAGLAATASGGAVGAAAAAAGAAAGATASPGATLRRHPSMTGSRQATSPGTRPGSATSAGEAGRWRVGSARGDGVGGDGAGFSGCPGASLYSAPPPSPPPPPPPTTFVPHSIAELVRDTQPGSWSRSSHQHLGSHAAANAGEDEGTADAAALADLYAVGAWAEVMTPVPFPQAKQNPLVRVYPVALLRHMGLLHPLDTTPDVDSATGLPVLISAAEAFRPWETRMAARSKPGTATSPITTSASTAAPSTSAALFAVGSAGTKLQLAPVGGDGFAPMVVVVPVGLTSSPVDGEPYATAAVPPRVGFEAAIQRVFPPSSSDVSLSGLDASNLPNPRRMTAAAPATLAAQTEAATDSPVFLTEPGVDWGRQGSLVPPVSPLEADSAVSTPPAADADGGSADSSGERELGGGSRSARTWARREPSDEDAMRRVVICTSLTDAPSFLDGAGDSGDGANMPTHRSIASASAGSSVAGSVASPVSLARAANSSTSTVAGGGSTRLRPVLVSAAPPTPKAQARAMRKLAYLRTALENVSPHALRLREEQMMLVHVAGQLDRSRRIPPLPTTASSPLAGTPAAAVAAAAKTGRSNASDGSGSPPPRVGEHTAKLLSLWRQRAGDADVSSVAKALGSLSGDVSPEARATAAGAVAAEAAAAEHPAAARAGEVRREAEERQAKSRGGVGASSSRSSVRGSVLGHSSAPRSVRDTASSGLPRTPSVMRLHRPHDTEFGALSAYMSQLQSRPAEAFGLELFALMVPCEPPAPAAPVRSARAKQSTPAAAPTSAMVSRRGPRLGASRAAGMARPETSLPMIAVQQELQAIQVRLPSTLRADESERMSLRRFDAAFNPSDKHGTTRR